MNLKIPIVYSTLVNLKFAFLNSRVKHQTATQPPFTTVGQTRAAPASMQGERTCCPGTSSAPPMSPPKSRRPSVRQDRFRVRLGIRQHREVPNQALRPERSEQTESSDSKQHALLTHRGQLGSLDCSGIFVLGIANPMATSDATELQVVGLDPWQELECQKSSSQVGTCSSIRSSRIHQFLPGGVILRRQSHLVIYS